MAAECAKCRGKLYRCENDRGRAVAVVCECASTCQTCGGVGYVHQARKQPINTEVVRSTCSTKGLEHRVLRFNEAGIPGALAAADFDNYGPPPFLGDQARGAAMGFALTYRRNQHPRGFVFSGPVGTGKTHLLVATVAYLVLEAGVDASYIEVRRLFRLIRAGFQEGKCSALIVDPLSKVEVLAIDDLGGIRGSPFELGTLDELVARRYDAGHTTLFATTFSLAPEKNGSRRARRAGRQAAAQNTDLLRDRIPSRIYSRLHEMCEFVEFPAKTPDHRRVLQETRSERRARRQVTAPVRAKA